MSELKLCPFCGGKPNKMHEHNNHALDVIVWCECESMRDVDYMRVNEWNARAPHDKLTEQNKVLREALVKVVSADSFHYQDDAEFAEAINHAKDILEQTKC